MVESIRQAIDKEQKKQLVQDCNGAVVHRRYHPLVIKNSSCPRARCVL